MIPECDGVRVISSEKCEFLQRVPGITAAILLCVVLLLRQLLCYTALLCHVMMLITFFCVVLRCYGTHFQDRFDSTSCYVVRCNGSLWGNKQHNATAQHSFHIMNVVPLCTWAVIRSFALLSCAFHYLLLICLTTCTCNYTETESQSRWKHSKHFEEQWIEERCQCLHWSSSLRNLLYFTTISFEGKVLIRAKPNGQNK